VSKDRTTREKDGDKDRFRRAVSRKDHRVTTVSLPRELHEELATYALRKRVAMTEVIRDAITDYLSKDQ
jgi:hypothetical protein